MLVVIHSLTNAVFDLFNSEMEVQNLQLSMEQISTSTSSYLHCAASSNSGLGSDDSIHVSSPSSSRSAATLTGKTTRSHRNNKRRTSPYPAPSPPASTVTPTAPVAASASIISTHPLMHDDYNNQLANMAAMDYRYDLQPSSSNQYLTPAMYSSYNSSEVHLYQYAANGESTSDLYPYYNEGNMYPLRHYAATAHPLAEGLSFFLCRLIDVFTLTICIRPLILICRQQIVVFLDWYL